MKEEGEGAFVWHRCIEPFQDAHLADIAHSVPWLQQRRSTLPVSGFFLD